MDESLNGKKSKAEIGEEDKPDIGKRMGTVYSGVGSSSYGPTGTHRKSLEIALQELKVLEWTGRDREHRTTVTPQKMRAAGSPYFEGMEYPPNR
ncbi:MAG: hypothetical protein H6606_10915 [Flavobacteriales bacterium]|nr:hypothetical protein [Flavobacteriales bacterium]